MWCRLFVFFIEVSAVLSGFFQAKRKCCGDIGCFNMDHPWVSFWRRTPAPLCPEECPVSFFMYTRNNPTKYYNVMDWPNIPFNFTDFDGSKPMVFVVHSWIESTFGLPEFILIKDAYLSRVDVNFFFVDYGSCAYRPYPLLVSTARVIGAQAARFMQYLISNHGASSARIHLIGFGLGAHIAAYIAKAVPGISRLTGLEPTRPYFESFDDKVKLTSKDANFVEVGHTCTLPIIGMGVRNPIGHVDFYFNGGWFQPSCVIEALDNIIQTLNSKRFSFFESVRQFISCNHVKILKYYAEAIANDECTYWGERKKIPKFSVQTVLKSVSMQLLPYPDACILENCSTFGLETIDYPGRNSFVVTTNPDEPYCISNPTRDKNMRKLLLKYHNEKHVTENQDRLGPTSIFVLLCLCSLCHITTHFFT